MAEIGDINIVRVGEQGRDCGSWDRDCRDV